MARIAIINKCNDCPHLWKSKSWMKCTYNPDKFFDIKDEMKLNKKCKLPVHKGERK